MEKIKAMLSFVRYGILTDMNLPLSPPTFHLLPVYIYCTYKCFLETHMKGKHTPLSLLSYPFKVYMGRISLYKLDE